METDYCNAKGNTEAKGIYLILPKKRIKSPISNGSIYFIGDTRFDHKNIIKYTRRPFSNVTEMNRTIKNNWNSTVGENDIIYYFLGDWTFWVRGHKINLWIYWPRSTKWD